MPVFSITRSGDEVGTFVTEAEKISIGRSEENTIRIKLKSVSRSHAVVRKIGLDYHISDCESKNGVYVNGKKVDKCVLRDGDLIGIGNCSIHFSTHSRISSPEEMEGGILRRHGMEERRRHTMASQQCLPDSSTPGTPNSPAPPPPPNSGSISQPTPVKISQSLEGEIRVLEKAPAEIIVLSLIGRLHHDSTAKLARFLNQFLTQKKIRLVLDLQGTKEICSAGWNLIALQTRRFWAAGGRLTVCRLNLKLLDDFRAQKLGTVIEAFSSAYEAISIVAHRSCLPQIGTEIPDQKNSFANTSLKECVKLIIGRHGPLSCAQIKKKLSQPQFGEKRVSLLKVYLLLRKNNLHTKQNRERFYRSY